MKNLKYLSITLLAVLAGCSSNQDQMFDLGMHNGNVNYLARDLDKQQLQIVKSDVDINGFPDSPLKVTKLQSGVPYTGQGIPMAGSLKLSPVQTAKITSPYGDRETDEGRVEFHKGIDFGVPDGTPVYASGDGVVITTGLEPAGFGGYGNIILIKHSDSIETLSAHLSQIDVNVNDTVKAGQQVGKSGHTGNSNGPHLHFETRIKGKPALANFPVPDLGYYVPENPVLYVSDLAGVGKGDTVVQGTGKVK